MWNLGRLKPSVKNETPEHANAISRSGSTNTGASDTHGGTDQHTPGPGDGQYTPVRADGKYTAFSDRVIGTVSVGVLAALAAIGVTTVANTNDASAHESVGGTEYVVEAGETLSEIAETLNVDVSALAELNHIGEVNVVTSGTVLKIPPRRYDGPVIRHEVTSDETLSEIADYYNIAVESLQQLNGIDDPDNVVTGQTIEIPDLRAYFAALQADGTPKQDATLPPTDPGDTFVEEGGADREEDAESEVVESEVVDVNDGKISADGKYRIKEVEYIVQTGDTLSQIAEAHNVSTQAVLNYNGLTDEQHIEIAQLLVIPQQVPIEPVDRMTATFEEWAKANDLDPNLVKAVGWQESHWNPEAVSGAGAVGVTQIMPATAEFISGSLIGTPLDREVAEDNIRMGARYLAYLLELSGGDLDTAIASYYQGYTSVQRSGLRRDTQKYVAGVRAYMSEFESGALPDRDLVNSRFN